jgi:hypothetical protein
MIDSDSAQDGSGDGKQDFIVFSEVEKLITGKTSYPVHASEAVAFEQNENKYR